MKKLVTVLLVLVMILSLASCGGEKVQESTAPAESPASEKPQENKPAEEPSAPAEKPAEEKPAEKPAEPEVSAPAEPEAVLPEFSGVSHGMPFTFKGFDYAIDGYKEKVLRLWFTVKNDTEYNQSASYISAWDGLLLTQNGEKMPAAIVADKCFEDTLTELTLFPGTEIMFTNSYKLINETDTVHVAVKDDSNPEASFDIEISKLEAKQPEPFEWKHITQTDWLSFSSTVHEHKSTGVTETLKGYEVIDGTDWMGRVDKKVVRVISEVVNNSDKEQTVSSYFMAVQDGVELDLGGAKEKAETDIGINTKVPAGATVTISKLYILFNDDPVYMVLDDGTPDCGMCITIAE